MTTNNTTTNTTVNLKQRVRFSGVQGSLDVIQRPGKTGVSVFVRVKPNGQRAVIGCRNVFLKPEDAVAKFDALVAETEKVGWTRRAMGAGGVTASKFDAIPAPTALPASIPLAKKATGPVAVKKAAGGKK